MCWVIRLERNFLTVAGQRRNYTDFPQSHSFLLSILNCWAIVLVIASKYNSTRSIALGEPAG